MTFCDVQDRYPTYILKLDWKKNQIEQNIEKPNNNNHIYVK